jgi:hypothetical protein
MFGNSYLVWRVGREYNRDRWREAEWYRLVKGVHIADGVAYVANACRGVRSIDVGDPENPALLDTFDVLSQSSDM